MRINIYRGEKLIEQNKFFRNLFTANTYCKTVCISKYGTGIYYPVIVKKT